MKNKYYNFGKLKGGDLTFIAIFVAVTITSCAAVVFTVKGLFFLANYLMK